MSEFTTSVSQLFDRKAARWVTGYRSGGALAYRIAIFSEAARHLTPPPGRVLDFGCGTGHVGARLAEQGYSVRGCDFSSAMLEEGRRIFGGQIEFDLLDPAWSRLPYPDAVFDLAVASSVLEYVEDLTPVLAELTRVLRPGGYLLATVPNMLHAKRWLERASAGFLRLRVLSSMFECVPRTALYARYLCTSKNRFSSEGWSRRFAQSSLTVVVTQPAGPVLELFALQAYKA